MIVIEFRLTKAKCLYPTDPEDVINWPDILSSLTQKIRLTASWLIYNSMLAYFPTIVVVVLFDFATIHKLQLTLVSGTFTFALLIMPLCLLRSIMTSHVGRKCYTSPRANKPSIHISFLIQKFHKAFSSKPGGLLGIILYSVCVARNWNICPIVCFFGSEMRS